MNNKQYVTSEVEFFTEDKLDAMDLQARADKLQQTEVKRLIKFLNAVRQLTAAEYKELTYNDVDIRFRADEALRVLGRSMDTDYEPVLAQFFGFDQDNELVGLAFHYLAMQWRRPLPYADQIRHYVWGGEFDPARHASYNAIRAAGEYLAQTNCQDRQLLKKLLLIATASTPDEFEIGFFDDEQVLGPDIEKEVPYGTVPIECAVQALYRASSGKRWDFMTPREKHVDIPDPDVLFDKIRKILASPVETT
ncbi:hypothetical protein [Pseudovibrio sp. Ad37]|uniref:hypothetical protein n=1 Tax=Pseudovibrio sp. Ad37 TaxID=989422 RepID=UPI0007AEB74D|nr:hypothetical protein [Pseudovibrio sp. Ad37]KZL26495.1 hypothetical protein PsAD37_01816 [Pseudovibrio sp. Ad37]